MTHIYNILTIYSATSAKQKNCNSQCKNSASLIMRVIRGDLMKQSFGWDRNKRGPMSHHVWHDTDPALFKGAEHRSKFCSSSPAIVNFTIGENDARTGCKTIGNRQSKSRKFYLYINTRLHICRCNEASGKLKHGKTKSCAKY
jgi:hypothetical protein